MCTKSGQEAAWTAKFHTVVPRMWVFKMEFASYQLSASLKFEAVPILLDNLLPSDMTCHCILRYSCWSD